MKFLLPGACPKPTVFRLVFLSLIVAFLSFAVLSRDPTNRMDFDGDGKADIAVYHDGGTTATDTYIGSTWHWLKSGTGNAENLPAYPWGRTTDVPIPADYNGDCKVDPTIFRWFDLDPPYQTNAIWTSHTGGVSWGFGNEYGRKMARNFVKETGLPPCSTTPPYGQKAELGEFRRMNQSTDPNNPNYLYVLYWQTENGGLDYKVTNAAPAPTPAITTYEQVPVPEDYYGNDGESEVAVFNVNAGCYYYWQTKTAATPVEQCLAGVTIPAPGDYDGDGSADFAGLKNVSGTAVWVVRTNKANPTTTETSVGAWGGKPVAADYDGDNKTDLALVRAVSGSWEWSIRYSGNSVWDTRTYRASTDTPLAFPYFYIPGF